MNERALATLAQRFVARRAKDKAQRAARARWESRVERAARVLTRAHLGVASERELRALLEDTDAAGAFGAPSDAVERRLARGGIEKLRAALFALLELGEASPSEAGLRALWRARALSPQLASELLAARFPARYWIYRPGESLDGLARLGDALKSALPRGSRDDAGCYVALEPRMVRLRDALRAAGLAGADYFDADSLLRFARGELPEAAPAPRAYERAPEAPRAELREPAPEHPAPALSALLEGAFRAWGLSVPPWLAASFFLGLQVRGLVLLAGPSGMGKTRMVQAFSAALPEPSAPVEPALPRDAVTLTVARTALQTGRLLLPQRSVAVLDPVTDAEERELEVGDGTFVEPASLRRARYAGRDYAALSLRARARAWLQGALREGDTLVLEPVLDADERLAGFRLGTPSRWPLPGGRAPSGGTLLYLPVRPDWHDDRATLGYFNPLARTWEWTPLLRLLVRAARAHAAREAGAFVVLLDEVNLAPVEHYLAAVLSVLESGRTADGWTREALRFEVPEDAEGELPPAALRLPPNLYFAGTLNADEHTQRLSARVLDRAVLLPVEHFDPKALREPPSAEPPSESARKALLEALQAQPRALSLEADALRAALDRHARSVARLLALRARLEPLGVAPGYRALQELVALTAAGVSQRLFGEERASLDAALCARLLPALRGGESQVASALREVLGFCLRPDAPSPATEQECARAQRGEALPLTAARVRKLLSALARDGYVGSA